MLVRVLAAFNFFAIRHLDHTILGSAGEFTYECITLLTSLGLIADISAHGSFSLMTIVDKAIYAKNVRWEENNF